MISTLLISAIVAFGAYQVAGRSTLLAPARAALPSGPRRWVECPLCSGWWYGLACAAGLAAAGAAPWASVPLAPWAACGGALLGAEVVDLVVELREASAERREWTRVFAERAAGVTKDVSDAN